MSRLCRGRAVGIVIRMPCIFQGCGLTSAIAVVIRSKLSSPSCLLCRTKTLWCLVARSKLRSKIQSSALRQSGKDMWQKRGQQRRIAHKEKSTFLLRALVKGNTSLLPLPLGRTINIARDNFSYLSRKSISPKFQPCGQGLTI